MTQVKFRVAAYTDAAGRYNPEAPRNGNEDNMFVNADLGAPEGSPFFESDKETLLTEYGALLVVADGMGGMNAGEVASEIAVNVVKDAFLRDRIPHSAIENSEGREKYLKNVVSLADEAVKKHAEYHPECEGMGSTLVMAWLYCDEVSIAWLGDSRIYLCREPDGLRQLSKDHSYVQELVDKGKITEEEAFDHPYNNVITRSLGDLSKAAAADSLTIKLFKGDILLLNSDGLSGVLHNQELNQIIRDNRETMSACRSALWKAAEEAGWHDNVTAVLCEITEGIEFNLEPLQNTEPSVIQQDLNHNNQTVDVLKQKHSTRKRTLWVRCIAICLVLLTLVAILLYSLSTSHISDDTPGVTNQSQRQENHAIINEQVDPSKDLDINEISKDVPIVDNTVQEKKHTSLRDLVKSLKDTPSSSSAVSQDSVGNIKGSQKTIERDSIKRDTVVKEPIPVIIKDTLFPKLESDKKEDQR